MDEYGSTSYMDGESSQCQDRIVKTNLSKSDSDLFNIGGITYKIEGKDAVTVKGFEGDPISNLIIPSRVVSPLGLEYKVTKIGKDAFKNVTQIESLIIPGTVTELDKQAFSGCDMLKKLVLPISVKCHYDSKNFAFKGVQLTDLTLTVGMDGSQDRDKEFWKSWKDSLKQLVVDDGIFEFTTSFKGWKELEAVTLNEVQSIQKEQFMGCNKLVTIIAPNVTSVSDNAFMNCTSLTTVDLASFESYTKGMFLHCNNLTTIVSEKLFINSGQMFMTLGDGTAMLVQQLNEDSEVVMVPLMTISSIGIHYEVTTIGKEAFRDNETIKEVFIHDKVVKIDEHAFLDCNLLVTIVLPIGVDCCYNTKKFAFEGVEIEVLTLTSGGYDPEKYMDNEFWKPFVSSIEILTLGDGITHFETSFKGKRLVALTMDSVQTIHKNQFKDCKKLAYVSMPDAREIMGSAFKNCEALVNFQGLKVTDVGDKAFSGCLAIVKMDSTSLRIIGKESFYNCRQLEGITYTNVEEIKSKAFWDTDLSRPDKSSSSSLKVSDDAYGHSQPSVGRQICNLICRGITAFGLTSAFIDLTAIIANGVPAFLTFIASNTAAATGVIGVIKTVVGAAAQFILATNPQIWLVLGLTVAITAVAATVAFT